MKGFLLFVLKYIVLPLITGILAHGCGQKEARREFVIFQKNVEAQKKRDDATWLERLRMKRCDGGGPGDRPGFPAPGAPAPVGAEAPAAVGEPGKPDRVTLKLESGL